LSICATLLRCPPLGFFQRRLGCRDGSVAALTFLQAGFLFALPLAFAPLLLFLEGQCSLAGGLVVQRPGRRLPSLRGRLGSFFLAFPMGRSMGSSASSLNISFEPTARRSTIPGLAIVAAIVAGSSDSFAKP
jgi:hypothetical protein